MSRSMQSVAFGYHSPNNCEVTASMPDSKRPAESYARIYDDAVDNLKLSRLRPEQFGLFFGLISYSHRCDTDGKVPWDKARTLLNFSSQGFAAAVRGLEKAKLIENRDHILTVHDYALHNETHAERNARRIAASNAARIRWGNADSNALAMRGAMQGKGKGEGKGKYKENQEEKVEPEGSTVQVFEAWKTSTGKTGRARLDAKRQRLISHALQDYTLADILDAVDGWRFIAHNRGENDQQRKFNDLELLLRDSQHIERFRDAKRNQSRSESGPQLWVDPYAEEEAARDTLRRAGTAF